jgi:hypothetical protein
MFSKKQGGAILLNLQSLLSAQRINSFLSKNNIEIIHFIPGRIRLRISHWQNKHQEMLKYIQEMEQETGIISVSYTPETNSLLVQYDKSLLTDMRAVESWLYKAEKIMGIK